MNGAGNESSNSGNSGNNRRRGGHGAKKHGKSGGNTQTGGGLQKRGHAVGRGPAKHGGGKPQQHPIEIVVRSSRNAVKRHNEGIRDEQARLACRSLLMALHGNLNQADNPGEVLSAIEQVQHALHQPAHREVAELPIALRAVVAFVHETPARQRAATELIRLLLRHIYALNADYIPRQSRDDGRFRANATLGLLAEVASEVLDDEAFKRMGG